MRVFLVGFMGSGKSHTGKRLATLLGAPFIDLDQYVVQRAGKSIAEIFATHSEAYFRELEREVLMSLTPLPYFVMATGGGTPCYHQTIDHLNDMGTTVFLDPTVAILVERLGSETAHRPLLNGEGTLEQQITRRLDQRRACYEKASIHIRFDKQTEDVAREIKNKLTYQTFD